MLKTLKMSKKVQMKNFKLMDSGALQHPNKAPFTCSLFAIDIPSDGSPHGADGKLIRISSTVCDQFLSTFEGMGMNIDYEDGMTDHEVRFKVGVITKTFQSLDGMAMAEGYIFAKDFPDVVATIRYYNGLALEHSWEEYQFGTSIEMDAKVSIAHDDPNVLDVIEFCGTGAAILFAESAAYKTTSFAAKNNKPKGVVNDMTPEQIKAMEDGMKLLQEGMSSITASVQTVVTEVAKVTTEVESIKAAKVDEDATTELKAAQDKASELEQELRALKASKTIEPERKTISASSLLSKFGNAAGTEATDIKTFCAAVDQLNLSTADSFNLKMQARSEFAKKESV